MEDQRTPKTESLNSQESLTSQEVPSEIKKEAITPSTFATKYYQPYVPRNKKPAYIAFKARVTSPKGLIITVLSILLGILFTETILLGSMGISIPVITVAFYGILFYFFRENDKPLNKAALYLTIPVILLAFSFFIHYNPSTQFITWLTLIGLICIQLILISNIQVNGIFSFDMFVKVIINLIGKPFSNIGMPFNSFTILKGNKSKAVINAIYIFIGLAVALPIAAVLMSLFMSADAVFADAMNTVYEFIGIDFTNTFLDILLGLIFGLFLAAILLGLKYSEDKQKSAKEFGNNIESTIIGTFLTIINIFIIAFVAFQFVYLFGGTVNITASGMSYADYARRGFFELSTASGIIFAIALFVLIMTKKKGKKLPLWIQFTTVCLCVCNGVLLVSAVKRMLLYVGVYGLSIKRVMTLWFMCIIGLCLAWIIIKCFVNKMDLMKWIGLTVILSACVLSLTNTERIIAKYNVDRYLSSPAENSIDIYYLSQLSYTAVPEIVRLKDLREGTIDIKSLLKDQEARLTYRNSLYGFTLDSLEARRIFDRELK